MLTLTGKIETKFGDLNYRLWDTDRGCLEGCIVVDGQDQKISAFLTYSPTLGRWYLDTNTCNAIDAELVRAWSEACTERLMDRARFKMVRAEYEEACDDMRDAQRRMLDAEDRLNEIRARLDSD